MLTLAQARKSPGSATGFEADEVKTWQPFLAPPLPALARRMEWLEQRNPGGVGVRLYVNAAAQREKFGGAGCEVWNPPADSFSAPRVLARFAGDEPGPKGTPPIREAYRRHDATPRGDREEGSGACSWDAHRAGSERALRGVATAHPIAPARPPDSIL